MESPLVNQFKFIKRNKLNKFKPNNKYNLYPDSGKIFVNKVSLMFSRHENKIDEEENLAFYNKIKITDKSLIIVSRAKHGNIASDYWRAYAGFVEMVFQ